MVRSGLTAILMVAAATAVADDGTKAYAIDQFAVSLEAPAEWEVVREEIEEVQATLAFLLPPLWSEAEDQEVRNVVSVTAHRRKSIASRQDVVDYERWRIGKVMTSDTEVESPLGEGHVFETRIKGFRYLTFAAMEFREGVGYVVAFTATNGTYDTNLPTFMAFLDTVKIGAETAQRETADHAEGSPDSKPSTNSGPAG